MVWAECTKYRLQHVIYTVYKCTKYRLYQVTYIVYITNFCHICTRHRGPKMHSQPKIYALLPDMLT
jgi:hypothetical protein